MAKNLSGRNEGWNYLSSTGPDVCWTPMGSSMVPVAYNIIAPFDSVVQESTTVLNNGFFDAQLNTRTTRIFGHEPGTGMGVVVPGYKKYSFVKVASPSVASEGFAIIRDGDAASLNRPDVGVVELGAVMKEEKIEISLPDITKYHSGIKIVNKLYPNSDSAGQIARNIVLISQIKFRYREEFGEETINAANATGKLTVGSTEGPSDVYCINIIEKAIDNKKKKLNYIINKYSKLNDAYARGDGAGHGNRSFFLKMDYFMKKEYDEIDGKPLHDFIDSDEEKNKARYCIKLHSMQVKGINSLEKGKKDKISADERLSKFDFNSVGAYYDHTKIESNYEALQASLEPGRIQGDIERYSKQIVDSSSLFNSFKFDDSVPPEFLKIFKDEDNQGIKDIILGWSQKRLYDRMRNASSAGDFTGVEELGRELVASTAFDTVSSFAAKPAAVSLFSGIKALSKNVVEHGLLQVGKRAFTGDSIRAVNRKIMKYMRKNCMGKGCLAGGVGK